MKFNKMQALGNDFVIVDASQLHNKQHSVLHRNFNKNFFSNICNRTYGIGCDLAVLYLVDSSSEKRSYTVNVAFFNPDGEQAEICGNAARCIGLLMKRQNNVHKCTLKTKDRMYEVKVNDAISVSVEMGQLSFNAKDIGLSKQNVNALSIIDELNLPNDLGIYSAACCSIGNPHLVLFCKNLICEEKTKSIGAYLENYSLFKNKINVSFATIMSDNRINLSVFERSAGLTLSCGACASAAIACMYGLVKSKNILVDQKGGTLAISIDECGNISQSGHAAFVFQGEIEI